MENTQPVGSTGTPVVQNQSQQPVSPSPIQTHPPRKSPKKLLFLIILMILIALGIGYFFYSKKSPGSEVIAEVQGQKLTKQDLADFDRIYSAVNNYQRSATDSANLRSNKEPLDALIEQKIIEIEAKKKGINVSQEEINARKKPAGSQILSLYNWTEADYEKSLKNQILREKVEDVVTTWREAEFVSIRFDVLETRTPDMNDLTHKAEKYLFEIRADFKNGRSVKDLAERLKNNQEVLKDFPINAIQHTIVPPDEQSKRLTRTTYNYPFAAELKILELKVPTTDEFWCAGDACYLIRISAGNDGSYKTLNDFFEDQK